MGEVLGSRGSTKAKKLRNGGTLFARVTTAPVQELGTMNFNMRGIQLKNVDGLFGKSDPYLEISAKVSAAGGLTWHPVYRSSHVLNNLNPIWPPFTVGVTRLCDGDLDKPILVEIWDWNKSGKNTSMGKFETSANGLLAAQVGEGGGKTVDTSKAFNLAKKGKDCGKIVVTTARLEGYVAPTLQGAGFGTTGFGAGFGSNAMEAASAYRPASSSVQPTTAIAGTAGAGAPVPFVPGLLPPPMAPPLTTSRTAGSPKFTDYLAGGCELELTIAIDFTGSNGDPRVPGTLHYRHTDGQLNDYEKAITAVGGVIARYDSDQKFPVFGFGAKYGGVIQHCFQIGRTVEIDGLSGVLEAYREVFSTGLTMSGPTVFSEVVDFAAAAARSKQEEFKRIGKQSYRVLLIVTDGEVTDIEQTKRAISAASDAPLSIVIVGVGNANFRVMQDLDDFLGGAGGSGRDIVQFVEFSNHSTNRSSLTRATLEEIPDQVVDYFTSRGIKPLPPISGSQFSLQAEECTDEDIDLTVDINPDGEISLANNDGAYYDDTKYATLADYSSVTPMAAPTAPAPCQPSSAPFAQALAPPVQAAVFHVQVPANVTPGMQLQIQHPTTKQEVIVTVPSGAVPGGTFAVPY